MASDILDRVGMVITDTGASSQTYVTANVLIGERFNTPQQAGAIDTKSYWWMIEEDNDFQIFEGHWDLANARVFIDTIWQSKILGLHGTTKMTLAGNATLRSVTPAEALNYLRFDAAQVLTETQKKRARANAGVNDNSLIINGDFRINERRQVSNVALASGAYGHDRWKAGAGGCTYTFVQLDGSTVINITAGTLIQVIEEKDIEAGAYVLNWFGTAQARVGIGGTTPGGVYAAGPIAATGQPANAKMSVEFGVGTLGKVKLEIGAVPTPFVMSNISIELRKCRRFARVINSDGAGEIMTSYLGQAFQTTGALLGFTFDVEMRAAPSITGSSATHWELMAAGSGRLLVTGIALQASHVYGIVLNFTSGGGLVPGDATFLWTNHPQAQLVFSAEL